MESSSSNNASQQVPVTATAAPLPPVEQERREVVARIAQGRIVEGLVARIGATCTDKPALQDLGQMVYEILLTYDAGKVVEMAERGQLRFFIVRLILNLARKSHSAFYKAFRDYRRRALELAEDSAVVQS